jgi:hypothetical protein
MYLSTVRLFALMPMSAAIETDPAGTAVETGAGLGGVAVRPGCKARGLRSVALARLG